MEPQVDPYGLSYPVMALWLDVDERGEFCNERFRFFKNAQEFGLATAWELRLDRRPGTLILDNSGRTFQIKKVTRRGFVTPLWLRILMHVLRDPGSIKGPVEYELGPERPITFADAKARVRASILRNEYDWVDDEAMAGEGSPPLKLEDVLAGATDAVDGASTLRDLLDRLEKAWPY